MIPSEIAPKPAIHSLRPIVMGRRGMVVAGTPLAAHAGTRILAKGGNAIDAAVAAAAVQAVVMPHMCGFGGDLFLLYYRPDGTVRALNASGPAPRLATIEAFRSRGFATVPPRGIEAVSVPGAVDGWFKALSDFGKLSPPEVFESALDFATNGFPIHKNFLRYLASPAFEEVRRLSPSLMRVYSRAGKLPVQGDYIVQRQIARTLEHITVEGPEAFYRGPTADLIIETSSRLGGFLLKDDLAKYESNWVDPLHVDYMGLRVFQVPPNSQGITMLQQLRILDKLGVTSVGHNTPDLVHILVEVKKQAFRDRDRFVGDPEFASVPVEEMLSDSRADEFTRALALGRTAEPPATSADRVGSDTTCVVTVDADGQAVALIQSLFDDFGSGVFVEEAGFALQNRMCGFSLTPGHPNALAPTKRPLHTLCCSMVSRDGLLQLAYATPGGHAQTQTLVQVLNNNVVFGMDMQEAVEAPRFSHEGGKILLERRINEDTRKALLEKGHRVEFLPSWSSVVGGCAAIAVHDRERTCFGGADPRRDSYASIVV